MPAPSGTEDDMNRRILGTTGMSVSEFALGTMMLGAMGNTDHQEGVAMIHSALDAGINFVDTADVYSGGESEEIVGQALKGRRQEVVLATKFALPMDRQANHAGGSARWIKQAVEDSLRRLDTATSTSTRCIGPTTAPTSTTPWPLCPTWSGRGRCASSAARPFRPN
jgi:diketogulonate reductase-like aldo/keto reductase